MKKLSTLIFAAISIFALSISTFAHSGRTDSSGGHRDNQNKSGLGSYHYHCSGNPPHLHTNGGCPYAGGASNNTNSTSSSSSSGLSVASNSTNETTATITNYIGDITLSFSFGQRTGNYVGDYGNGLPNGKGKFTTINEDGVAWTYDGQWIDGHLNGFGITTWEDVGWEYGIYKNDVRTQSTSPTSNNLEVMTQEEISDLYNDIGKYAGRELAVKGKIISIENIASHKIIYINVEIEGNLKKAIILIYDMNFKCEIDDYISLNGILCGLHKEENLVSGQINIPKIDAVSYAISQQ